MSHEENIAVWPATRLAQAIRATEISSRELLDVFLARIERLNPAINAVVTLDLDGARAAAVSADETTARGDALGPLHGLPTTIKDAIEVGGMRSTGGAVELRDHVPAADAPVIARLRAAGAIVVGKTNAPRWSGDLQTYNEIFGTTNNPWDTTRVPGGSSGGAAAAVACGLTSFEIGTDIAGSVRTPSHFCGVYGLKPSFGVVPQRGYLDHVGGGTTDADINVFGPIARSPGDLELLLDVVAGAPPENIAGWHLDLPAPRYDDLGSLRIAVWFDQPSCPLDTEYRATLQGTVDQLADAGAKIDDAHPPIDFDEQFGVFMAMLTSAVSVSFDAELREAFGGSHYQWLVNDERRAALRRTWAEWFQDHDVLVCPVTPTPAFPHNQEGDFLSRTTLVNGEELPYANNIKWAGVIGHAGLPSCVVPIGRTSAALPVGMQIVTPYLRDREAIRTAELVRDILGGFQPPPMALAP